MNTTAGPWFNATIKKELDLHGQKKVIPLELTVIHQVRLCLLTAARLERTEVRYPFFFCDS